MNLEAIPLSECFVFTPTIYQIEGQGKYLETFNYYLLEDGLGLADHFVQEREFIFKQGVLVGLHVQRPPKAQCKLIRITQGNSWNVLVDIRTHSPTFRKWFGIHLNEENHKQLYVPEGVAHGALVLSESATFIIKATNYDDHNRITGVRYDDPDLNIDWRSQYPDLIVNSNDQELPYLDQTIQYYQESLS